jgi:hypothetical protein
VCTGPIDLYGLLGLVADEPRVGATVREMACRAAAARLASSSSSAEELTSDVGGGQQAVDEHEIERLTAKQVKTFCASIPHLLSMDAAVKRLSGCTNCAPASR